ncbi:hypothetical protein QOZ80_7BG0600270 [Eleusine coracana subsp. coracana]|nr:hypothetical protein QOZ80_7BG0600270 [Eleusine coracana subsp. coracana]
MAGPTSSEIGSVHRRERAAAFLEHFNALNQKLSGRRISSFVLGGDFGWDDDLDGPLRLPDAWLELRGDGDGDGDGKWTYDVVANRMLRGLTKPGRRKADRFICKLKDFTLVSIEMVGVEPIPGVTRFDDEGNACRCSRAITMAWCSLSPRSRTSRPAGVCSTD